MQMEVNVKASQYHRIVVYGLLILNLNFNQSTAYSRVLKSDDSNSTCATDDLNHSVLIKCFKSICEGESNQNSTWPLVDDQLFHIQSSRDGERFSLNKLQNLNVIETEQDRLWDINSTLYISTDKIGQQVYGFGTSLDAKRIAIETQNGMVDKSYLAMIGDLFKNPTVGLGFSLLRVHLTRKNIRGNDTTEILTSLDQLLSRVLVNEPARKIRMVLTLENIDDNLEMIESLKLISTTMKSMNVLECWAIGVEQEWLTQKASNEGMLGYIQELFSTKNILGVTRTREAPAFIDHISESQSSVQGLLIRSEFGKGYDALNHVRSYHSGHFNILTIGGVDMGNVKYGDWERSQHYGVQILKELEHGSNGFLEDSSYVSPLENPELLQERSIYSFLQSHDVHLRGPMYYAIGHFSRYIASGSRKLGIKVMTSPNMFAAHYSAFKTPHNHVVAVVLNDNEHMLSFRMVVDGIIVAHINLKPKSFNTIVLKA